MFMLIDPSDNHGMLQ